MGDRVTSLSKRSGEKPHHHRALLLFAMQDPEPRSNRAVAQAMSRGETTVRGWRHKYLWDQRVEAIEDGVCQAEAMRLYRELYFVRYGAREMAVVEHNMSTSILTVEAPPAVGKPGEGQKLEAQHALESGEVRRKAKRHLNLIDAVIGAVIPRVKAGKFQISPRDLPTYIKLRAELADVLSPAPSASGPVQLQETVRVQQARATGGDLIEAMAADAEELAAIFGAIRAKRDQEHGEGQGQVVELHRADGEGA